MGNVVASLTRGLNRGLFWAKKNADKIEMIGGTICVAAGTGVLIHDAGKIADAQNELYSRVNYIKEADSQPEGEGWADKEERKKYVEDTYKTAAVQIVKGAWKGVALITVGEVLQGVSHATLNKKYQVVNTALAGTTLAFNKYRERVVADQGKQKDYEYLTGEGTMVAVEQRQDGTVTTTEVPLHKEGDARTYIPHSFFLGDTRNFYLTSGNNGNIARGIDDVMRGLRSANDYAKFKGYVFENLARERCDVNPTVAGQAAGMFYENPDGSTNELTLLSKGGVEIGDPSLLDGKPDDILFEFAIKTHGKDGSTSISPIDSNILDRIDMKDPHTNEPKLGWLKC